MDPVREKKPSYNINVCGYDELEILMWQMNPSNIDRSLIYNADNMALVRKNKHPKGAPKADYCEILKLDMKQGIPQTIDIDLTPVLQFPDELLGQVQILVQPTLSAWKKCKPNNVSYEQREIVCSWIQVTKLSMEYIVSQKSEPEITVYMTTLNNSEVNSCHIILMVKSQSKELN
jgi:hypothetical protein